MPHEPRSLPSSLSAQCTHHFAQCWRGSPGPPWLLPTAQWTTPQLVRGQLPKARRIHPLDVALSWGTSLFGTVLGLRSMPYPPSCWWPGKGVREAGKKANPSETGQCLVLNGPLRVNYPRRRKSRGPLHKQLGVPSFPRIPRNPHPGPRGQTFFLISLSPPVVLSRYRPDILCSSRRYIRSIPPSETSAPTAASGPPVLQHQHHRPDPQVLISAFAIPSSTRSSHHTPIQLLISTSHPTSQPHTNPILDPLANHLSTQQHPRHPPCLPKSPPPSPSRLPAAGT